MTTAALLAQVAICMQRGAQSGGLLTLTSDRSASTRASASSNNASGSAADATDAAAAASPSKGLLVRVMPSKRQNLSKLLAERVRLHTWVTGLKPPGDNLILMGHTRFATSSSTSVGETHPHTWAKQHAECVWQPVAAARRGGRPGLAARQANVGLWVTHNGACPCCCARQLHGAAELTMKELLGLGLCCPCCRLRVWWHRPISEPPTALPIPSCCPPPRTTTTLPPFAGDFEFYELWGRDRTHGEVAQLLEVLLEAPQPAACDSAAVGTVLLAGLVQCRAFTCPLPPTTPCGHAVVQQIRWWVQLPAVGGW